MARYRPNLINMGIASRGVNPYTHHCWPLGQCQTSYLSENPIHVAAKASSTSSAMTTRRLSQWGQAITLLCISHLQWQQLPPFTNSGFKPRNLPWSCRLPPRPTSTWASDPGHSRLRHSGLGIWQQPVQKPCAYPQLWAPQPAWLP